MKQPGIRAQAYLVAALPLVFLVVLLVLSLMIQRTSQEAAIVEQHTQLALSQVDELRGAVNEASRAVTSRRIEVVGPRLAAARAEIDAHIRSLTTMLNGDPAVRDAFLELQKALSGATSILDSYAAARRRRDAAAAERLAAAASTRRASLRLNAAYDRLVNHERGAELRHLGEVRTLSLRYEFALVVVCIAAIVLTLLVSGRFGLGIARRLEHLAENARALARGRSATPLAGEDEFAHLDRVYRNMMHRIAREHRISSTLQRRLLPQQLPQFDGIRLDTAYVPASEESEVGGDWYDAFALSDRCICMSIGDVAGHGLQSATVMAGARLAVRTAARIESDPGHVMAHVNRILCTDEPGTLVSAFVGFLDLETGDLRYAVAGHPEPLLISADREVDVLSGKGLLLGVDARECYVTYRATVHEGSALLLYTDGLIEIEHDYFTGLDDLQHAASEEFTNSNENIAEAIQRRLFHGRRAPDDAAVLFVGVTGLGPSALQSRARTWDFDARDAQSARRAKRAILWYLGNQLQEQAQLAWTELVLGELIGNVARHSPGPARVTVKHEDRGIILEVSDSGKPFSFQTSGTEPSDLLSESGRGLFMVRSVAADVQVRHTGAGNTVRVALERDHA